MPLRSNAIITVIRQKRRSQKRGKPVSRPKVESGPIPPQTLGFPLLHRPSWPPAADGGTAVAAPPETNSRESSSAPPGRSSMPSSDLTSSLKEISASVGSSRLLRCVSNFPCSLLCSFGDLVGEDVVGMHRFALSRLEIWLVRIGCFSICHVFCM